MAKFDKSHTSRAAAKTGSSRAVKKAVPLDLQSNSEYRKIAPWLLNVKFQKKFFGGLDPLDVWKKFEELNAMYEKALMAERIRCDMLMERVQKNAAAKGLLDKDTPDIERQEIPEFDIDLRDIPEVNFHGEI